MVLEDLDDLFYLSSIYKSSSEIVNKQSLMMISSNLSSQMYEVEMRKLIYK